MKIAVTGAGGMIGSMLIKALKEKGHTAIECTKKNCDITDFEEEKRAIAEAEVVVHCAAQLDEEAADLYEVNVQGTDNVLEASASNNVNQFIFLSTVGVFGAVGGVKTESTEPRPETAYERSKLEAEKKVLSFQEVFSVTIIRPAIILGNNVYWSQIVRTIAKGFPLIGEGKNHWQAVCPEDVVSAIVFCFGREECFGEIFIVAEKESMTLEEIANRIRKELGMNVPIGKIPLWLGGIIAQINSVVKFNPILKPAYVKRLQRDRLYSTEKLEKLGWKAKCSAMDALPKVVKHSTIETKK